MESPDMIDIALVIWFIVAVPVCLATLGHMWAVRKNMHTLDLIVYSLLSGALWPLWLFKK